MIDKAVDHPPHVDMTQQEGHWNPDLAGDYDRIAKFYADAYANDLGRAPFDQALLNRFAELVHGPVCDLGCGPGHVTAYLRLRGAQAFGLDLSPRMIDLARRRYPAIPFQVGDMRALDLRAGSLGAIVAFYSLIHLRRNHVVPVLQDMARVLGKNGRLLVGCHRGQQDLHADERFGQPVSLDATLFEPAELAGYATEAGFDVEETVMRRPYEFEVPLEKLYLFAVKRST